MHLQHSSEFADGSNIFFDNIAAFSQGQALVMQSEECLFSDSILDNILHTSHIDSETPRPNQRNESRSFSTGVFRSSDMNVAATCVNGVQHFESPLPSPPMTPGDSCGDRADTDYEHGHCTKCHQNEVEKKTRRREQNRQSQRKFRARKEAKLSDARSRIASLEALVKAQEKTNTVLKLRIEQLCSASQSAVLKSQTRDCGVLGGLNAWAQRREEEDRQDWVGADALS